MSGPPVAPPVRPGPAPGLRGAVTTLVVGLALVLLGAALAGPRVAAVVGEAGVCAMAPCRPEVPSVGFTVADGGAPVVHTGPRSAQQIETVEVRAGSDDGTDDGTVLWRVDRAGAVPEDWDGSVQLGRTPAGFRETTPLTGPLPAAAEVVVESACARSPATLPAGTAGAGQVLAYGEAVPYEQFLAEDTGFSACSAPPPPRPGNVLLGVVLLLAGAVVTLVGLPQVLAARRGRH
ncbi:hypothetical protein [Cellulomonas sp. NS3]|uniref:hypothetical protein n=1 Tax=Cellulomonas sp. NS3 TaxID=2973977 RepID=UPI0021633C2F|nr:hypothetical protein [Cellulomonas sp. NS3]